MWFHLMMIACSLPSLPDANTILERSIAYHDPDGRFLTQAHRFVFDDERPDQPKGTSEVLIDVPGERFEMTRRTDVEIQASLQGDRCTISLDGRTELTGAERDKYKLSCDRVAMFRDYYTYLWGLPMKLRDPGTHCDPPFMDSFEQEQVLAIKVRYDTEVGNDTWYFYFDVDTYALVGYRFYHDEAKNDGEYIVLDGELEAAGMRLPKSRRWLTHGDNRWLGTDHLREIRVID